MNKYLNEYFDYLKYQKNYSEYTIINYKEDLEQFLLFLNNKIEFTNLVYNDIKDYFDYLNNLNYSKSSIARKISTLKSFYKFLCRNKYVSNNPFSLVKTPKKEKKLPKFLYYNELEELFNIPDTSTFLGLRNKLILEILYATGIRVGELEKLKISDISIEENLLKVFGKGSKERIVFFDSDTKKILLEYLKQRKNHNSEYLLINHLDQPLTSRGIRYIIDEIIKKASFNTKISPHTLRHTFATHLLNEGCDITSVQELLGHSSLKATQVYTHITNDELRNIYLKCHPRNKDEVK